LGQNFLINQRAVEQIIATADLHVTDNIIEVGPGPGILTTQLAPLVNRVITIEKDASMIRLLSEVLAEKKINNVEIINQDILDYIPPSTHYKLVANIPYYITSPIIRKFLEAPEQPRKIVLLVQKEMAQRICARPPHMSILAVSVQRYARPKLIATVRKGSFWPAPKVDSAIIEIVPLAQQPNLPDSSRFFEMVKAGFSAPRKQLINNLSNNLRMPRSNIEKALSKIGINPQQRAETLTVANWQKLALLLPSPKLDC
jgi:16S rRNA (adenine1518-N6/adenine1519-N6)-dimethyltransferase